MLNILVISRIYGNKIVSSFIKYSVKSLSIDLVILAGDTVSPQIIRDIYDNGQTPVMGIAGVYDDVSIIKTLKDIDGFLEGHLKIFKGIKVAGIGVSIDSSINSLLSKTRSVDLLITYYPGRRYSIFKQNGLAKIDKFIDRVDAKLVVFGKGRGKCVFSEHFIYPGEGFKGYFTVLSFSENLLFEKVKCYNIYSFL